MHSRIIFPIVVLAILITSCKKESVPIPDNADLKGCWDQVVSDFFLDRESLCFDGQETLYYSRFATRAVGMDTLIYRFDNKDMLLYLRPATSPGSIESSHKIRFYEEKNVLSIWNLHSSSSGEESFKKQ